MEPRSHIVDPNGGEFTLYSSTQIPHISQFLLAATTGTPEHKIQMIAPDVDSGFSGKYQQVDELAINVVPLQKPAPPVYVAVLRREAAYHVGRKVWGHPWSGTPPEEWPTGRRP